MSERCALNRAAKPEEARYLKATLHASTLLRAVRIIECGVPKCCCEASLSLAPGQNTPTLTTNGQPCLKQTPAP